MAWRLNRYQDFFPNITVITAAFLNAVQDAVVDLYNGNYSLRRLLVDGTGDLLASYAAGVVARIAGGVLRLDGGVGDQAGELSSATAPTERRLTAEWSLGQGVYVGDVYLRLYRELLTGVALMFTVNARWDGALWQPDDDSLGSARLVFTAWGDHRFKLQRAFTGAAFAEGAWVDEVTVGNLTSHLVAAGDVTATASLRGEHVLTSSATPTVTLFDGAGTGASYTISGTDHAGLLTVTTGTSPTGGDTVARINLSINTLPSIVGVVFFPANNNAINLGLCRATAGVDSIILTGPTGGLTAITVYSWNYVLMV